MIFLVLFAIAYLTAINIKTYRAFAADKRFAINKEQRTPEATLLHLARIGGWVGAKIAQQKLRHKSYKQPFGHQLNMIGLLHAASVYTFVSVFGLLSLVPPATPVSDRAEVVAEVVIDDAPASTPDDELLAISLRPPAERPAR